MRFKVVVAAQGRRHRDVPSELEYNITELMEFGFVLYCKYDKEYCEWKFAGRVKVADCTG